MGIGHEGHPQRGALDRPKVKVGVGALETFVDQDSEKGTLAEDEQAQSLILAGRENFFIVCERGTEQVAVGGARERPRCFEWLVRGIKALAVGWEDRPGQ